MTTPSTPLSEEFTLLPLSLPDDAKEILRLHYQVHTSDPLYATNISTLPTEETFITSRLESTISRLSSKPRSIQAKLVLASQPEKMVAYIVFNPPEGDDRSAEEKDRDLKEEIWKRKDGVDKERILRLKRENGVCNERFLGRGYEGRWWVLDILVTDREYQRRGLGSRLVRWGLGEVEEDVKRWNGEREERIRDGEGEVKERVEGCYLVASPQGARTYEKAGFVKVGGMEIDMGEQEDAEKYMHVWFVKRFE